MRIGLVGWPGSGKTTLFAALGGARPALPGPTSLSDERAVVSVEVPDERLVWLRDHFRPKKFTPARIEFEDFAGIPKGSVKGKPELLAGIREMDALCLVLRGFTTDRYAYDRPQSDPATDARELSSELLFSDFAMLASRIERLEVSSKKPTKTQEQDRKELAFLKRLLSEVEGASKDIREISISAEEERMIRGFQFASQKPRILIVNVAEGGSAGAALPGAVAVVAELEAEIAGLPAEEKREFLATYGIESPFRDRLIQLGYETLGLRSFFTVGEDEVRAWTIRAGDDALTSAGKIHTDLARGFIRAEVIGYEDFRRAGGMREAKAQNLFRLEGKEYVVQDGEILNIRFSV